MLRPFVLALALMPALPARAAVSYLTAEMDAALMEGIDNIYRMRFEAAEAAASRAMAINPDHPHAYMGLAGVAWTRYVYGTDQGDPALLDEFEKRTKKPSRWETAGSKTTATMPRRAWF